MSKHPKNSKAKTATTATSTPSFAATSTASSTSSASSPATALSTSTSSSSTAASTSHPLLFTGPKGVSLENLFQNALDLVDLSQMSDETLTRRAHEMAFAKFNKADKRQIEFFKKQLRLKRSQAKLKTRRDISNFSIASKSPSSPAKISTQTLLDGVSERLRPSDSMKITSQGLEAFHQKDRALKKAEVLINLLKTGEVHWGERQRTVLIYLLNRWIARMHFNDELHRYHESLSGEALLHYLQQRCGDIELDPKEVPILTRLFVPSAEQIGSDLGIYVDLIELLSKHIKSDKLFDLLHQAAFKDALYEEKNEKSLLESITEKLATVPDTSESDANVQMLKIARVALTSDEHIAGQESPHLYDTAKLAKGFCTQQYITFLKYYRMGPLSLPDGSPMHFPDGRARFILENSSGEDYFEDLATDIADIEKELIALNDINTTLVEQAKLIIIKLKKQMTIKDRHLFTEKVFEVTYSIFQNLQQILRDLHAQQKSKKERKITVESETTVPSYRITSVDTEEEKKRLEEIAPALNDTPAEIKAFIKRTLDSLGSKPEESFEEELKEASELNFGNRSLKTLLRVMFDHKKEILDLLFKKKADKPITISELKHLVIAMGGTIEEYREGCRFRVLLNGRVGEVVGLPSLHSAHGSRDSHAEVANELTIRLFAHLFERAGVFETYKDDILNYLNKRKISTEDITFPWQGAVIVSTKSSYSKRSGALSK